MEFKELKSEEIAKLPPQERIAYLKKLEEQAKKKLEENKKIIEDSEKLIKQSEVEFTKEELKKEEQAFRQREALKELSALLKEKEENNLEGMAKQAPKPVDIVGLYSRVKEVKYAYVGEQLSYNAVQELLEVKEQVSSVLHYTQLSEDVQKAALASKRMVDDLLGTYVNKGKYVA